MYLIDFIYDGLKLSDLGCMVGNIVTDNGNTVEMGSVVELETNINHGSYTSEIINATYPDVYTVTFDIFKMNCGKGYKDVFDDKEVTWFMRWLNRKEYKKFIPIYDNPKDFYRLFYMGTFTECKALFIQGHVYGFTLTFTTNSPFAYLDYSPNNYEIVETNEAFDIIDSSTKSHQYLSGGSFILYDESEELGAVYPKSFKIWLPYEGGDLIIKNSMDDETRYTEIKNCQMYETITFDCIHKIVTAKRNNGSDHPGLYNDFNYVFPRIMNTFDECMNKYYTTLSCHVTIDYNPIRKVGIIV